MPITSKWLNEKGFIEYEPGKYKRGGTPIKKKREPAGIKTGWIDDYRNIRNKDKYQDQFIQLVKIELRLEVWPEFYFTTDRQWRVDYTIPVAWDGSELKIGIEVEGGAFSNGRHTRPVGFINDMTKYNKLTENGWRLIRVIPSNLLSLSTLQSINQIITNGK